MKNKLFIGFIVSFAFLLLPVGLVSSAYSSELGSPWDYVTDFADRVLDTSSDMVDWLSDYFKYGSRFDSDYGESGHGGGGYHRTLEKGIQDSVVYGPDPLEIESININANYDISGKFVSVGADGNKILYEIAFSSYDYVLSSAPSSGSDLWSNGGSVVLRKTDMNTGLNTVYSFPAVLNSFTAYTTTSLRLGITVVSRVRFWYLDGTTVRAGDIYFGQTADNAIQFPLIVNNNPVNDVTSGYQLILGDCRLRTSVGSNIDFAFILSSLDTNNDTAANAITEKYFGGNFGLAPVFIDNTYKAGNSYNVNNIAPELGFDYINGQLEINADVLGAKIDLVLDHLLELYNDFYSSQTAPYTSVTEGDTYNYIQVIQEPEPPVTYPPSTGGGGVPEEWLQHYPPIDTTPAIVADVPDLSYFEDLAVIPSASPTIFTMISQLVVDSGLMGVFSITFILAIAMYFFRR